MTRDPELYVKTCPITRSGCAWRSEPCYTRDAALEAFRGHLSAHTFPDLLEHIFDHTPDLITFARAS